MRSMIPFLSTPTPPSLHTAGAAGLQGLRRARERAQTVGDKEAAAAATIKLDTLFFSILTGAAAKAKSQTVAGNSTFCRSIFVALNIANEAYVMKGPIKALGMSKPSKVLAGDVASLSLLEVVETIAQNLGMASAQP